MIETRFILLVFIYNISFDNKLSVQLVFTDTFGELLLRSFRRWKFRAIEGEGRPQYICHYACMADVYTLEYDVERRDVHM